MRRKRNPYQDPMALDKLPWQDIFFRLALPPHVMAIFDWVGGVIIVNEDIHTFLRVRRQGATNPHEKEIVRTYSHEIMHFYQVLLTGYMYNFVTTIIDQVDHCMPIRQSKKNASWSDVEAYFDNLTQSDVGPWRDRLISTVEDLRKADSNGLSIMNIVEGQATYVEMKDTYSCNSGGFRQLLDRHRVSRDYRFAYDFVCQRLGEEAGFADFPLICSLALCSSHPILSFYRLINYIGSLKTGYLSAAQLTELINSCCVSEYIGFQLDGSGSIVQSTTKFSLSAAHYSTPRDAIRHAIASNQTGFDILDFYLDPQSQLAELGQITFPPIVFNPFLTGKIPFIKGRPEDPGFFWTRGALVMASAYRQLMDG